LEDRRFATADADYRFTLHQPVGQNVAALAEPSINSLHEVLPRYTLSSRVTRALPGGWGLGLGVRQTDYNFATSNLLSLSAERNWGSFRGAYTLYSNRADGAGFGSTHRFEVSYLYGDRNVVGFAYTTGRDLEYAGLPMGLIPGNVRDWTLSGRHWLSPNWALTYDLLGQEQGALYRGPGLRLGVSRSF
jgi:YaiO family outer membrane protein